jgi:hypothetical protein
VFIGLDNEVREIDLTSGALKGRIPLACQGFTDLMISTTSDGGLYLVTATTAGYIKVT